MKKQAKSNLPHFAIYLALFLCFAFASACEKTDFRLVEEQVAKTASNTTAHEKAGLSDMDEWVVEPRIIPSATVDGVAQKEKQAQTANAFSFDLIVSYCFAGAATVRADIANPERYVFLWEVDGGHGGHDSSTLACICGTSATVHVTRLSDGIRISRTAVLPACEDEKL